MAPTPKPPTRNWPDCMTSPPAPSHRRARAIARCVLGVFFVLAGVNHFVNTAFYVAIMPPWLPWHLELVWLSGVAEVLLGAMVLFRRTQVLGGWGLVALCMAVFPANIHMALNPALFPQFAPVLLWLRLPLQLLALGWIWWSTLSATARPSRYAFRNFR